MRRYAGDMSRDRRRGVAPIPRPDSLHGLDGKWVALVGDKVIAAAETSHQLALHLHSMDAHLTSRAVVEYVRPGGDAYIVGVG